MAVEKIACSPQIGDYHILADILIQRCLGYKTMRCPPTSKNTLEIGGRHSPDMICTPFKTTLGNFIEAAEQGANVFIMPGFGCRLGYYDILQKQILEDLGYKFEMITLFDYVPTTKRLYLSLKEINPNLTQEEFNDVFSLISRITVDMDNLSAFIRPNIAFEVNKGEYTKLYKAYLHEVKNTQTAAEAESIHARYKQQIESVAINKPERPIKIGIVGEIYLVVDSALSGDMEKWLAEHSVEIVREFDLTRMAVAIFTVPEQIENSGGYVNYNIGSTANDVVASAYKMMQDGVDGIIHVKPSSCPPEINAMTILQNMSADFDVPVMYMTFDTETGEAGIHTRLEAFHDMLVMKRSATNE